MIERTVDQNRSAFVALPGEIGKRLVSSDGLLGRRVDRIEQPALVIFARQPLNQAVAVPGESRQLSREKRVYVILPSRRRSGHPSFLFGCSRRRCRTGLCVNSRSYGRSPIPCQTIWPEKKCYAGIASFALLSNHRKVSRSPSRKEVFARQLNSASAREVSRHRRGWPSGFVASHRKAPSDRKSTRLNSSHT